MSRLTKMFRRRGWVFRFHTATGYVSYVLFRKKNDDFSVAAAYKTKENQMSRHTEFRCLLQGTFRTDQSSTLKIRIGNFLGKDNAIFAQRI